MARRRRSRPTGRTSSRSSPALPPRATAPRIPAGYGVPTDGSGGELLPWSWAVGQLEAARNYWICTTRADGRPHAAPVWGLWLHDAVWFSTGGETQKGRNIARDPRIVIHLESGDETVILEGEVWKGVADRFVPGSDRILVSMDAGGNERQQLYLLEPGGRPEPLVVEPDFSHWSPRLSADGRLVAYACNRRNGVDFDVFVRELESGEERVVFGLGGMCEPLGFSPDGRAVAVEQLTEKPGDNELWLVPLDGDPELLSPHDDQAFFGWPAWAGGHLYYATNTGRDTQAIVRHGEGVVLETSWDLACVADPTGRVLFVIGNAA